ncbi:MAG: nucleoside deaminase [Zunongwangia sp.]|jgi:tRNA(Arg) A34 adenosine deaminase TadA|uniref:Guanine deaminase n=1 Tax=Zunongwangia profunda (strain DSM 18752 / CCTCC AB 206139 / SM-A87) TaxID=655815 RepID=D5B9E3_ZUNPS|nr:nucleoside deaminase [Zunongwangia profunda]MAC64758.1 nucleoside deaminase [Flavobacteriaceae bacterium]MAO34462.1 nucleoside deaminase [Zunongwangia sp.]ADF52228.1 guanine deaminase [Zunongwangia profunda SM-A87]MAG88705.1 nucleoside deaminase [Flavobacteriaceae bacterium]MAS70993.1 nucleoside deaminase [Zunongwangia sp.]|tara:strand:- start:270 stop:746 length:477 start_codon:yes stop_codon:yes gene_type:complete
MTEDDKKFMRRAIALAEEGMNTGAGGPFGAVVVKDGEIIAEGWNIVTSSNDPTAHAEITAIRRACENLNTFQLENCVLYTSCEPCPMCLGAIYWARPKKVFYALNHSDAAKIGFDDQFIYEELDKDIENRKVPFVNILREEGLPVFEKWDRKENRIDY